jgi:hypothetical protein
VAQEQWQRFIFHPARRWAGAVLLVDLQIVFQRRQGAGGNAHRVFIAAFYDPRQALGHQVFVEHGGGCEVITSREWQCCQLSFVDLIVLFS